MFWSAALLLALGAPPIAVAPSIAVDLDGDGAVETATATPARGSVRLRISDAGGKKLADAKAPAPAADVVPVTLSSAPLGSPGALLEVTAATDTMECRTIWRYRDGALTPLPIRDASGKPLPDCGPAGKWSSSSWERESEGRPSAWVRERSETVPAGRLRTKETFSFAGFSLDYDPARSSTDIDGIPIPDWYRATLYSRAALEILYGRFNLAALREHPTLRIEADRARGVFALRFSAPSGEVILPVEAYAEGPGSATLAARAGEKSAHVEVRLEGGGKIPYEARVSGLEGSLDQAYSPAGSWRGGARQVFPDAAAEIAAEDLVGLWADSSGKNQTIAIEGEPPYRVRLGSASYTVDLDRAVVPLDLLLLPVEPSGRPRGAVLRGPNGLEVFSLACAGPGAGEACRPEGAGQTLRRVGARVNVR